MKYEKGKKITDKCQFKKGKKYVSDSGEVFEFSHIGTTGSPYFKDEGQSYCKEESEYNCIGFSVSDFYEAIEVQELPNKGLVVYKEDGTIIYRTGEGTGYGYDLKSKEFKVYEDDKGILWSFKYSPKEWRPATPEEETKFIELLQKECERRGLYKDTKIKAHVGEVENNELNKGIYLPVFQSTYAWNKNGRIFYNGKFAEPLEEETPTEETPELESVFVNGKEHITEEALLQRFKDKGFGLYKVEEREKEKNLTDEALKLQELAEEKGFKLVLTFEYINK